MRPALFVCFLLFAAPAWSGNDGATTDRDRPLIQAMYTLGLQYMFGGRSPEIGFDCSGLVMHVFERAWGLSATGASCMRPGRARRCASRVWTRRIGAPASPAAGAWIPPAYS